MEGGPIGPLSPPFHDGSWLPFAPAPWLPFTPALTSGRIRARLGFVGAQPDTLSRLEQATDISDDLLLAGTSMPLIGIPS